MDLNRESCLKKVLNSNGNVILFGAGGYGRLMFSIFKKLNMKIKYFCDNDINKHGKNIDEIKVISPNELSQFKRDTPIIITSDYNNYFCEIYEQLKKMKFDNLYYFSPHFIMEHYNELLYNSIANNIENIENLFKILEDGKSKNVLKSVLNYRLTFDINDLINCVSKNEMYFDKDIMDFKGENYFIDGGAYDGKTILKFIEAAKGNFKFVYSFEPDKNNFALLKSNKRLVEYSSKIKLENKGLYKQTGKVCFSNSANQGSCINEGCPNNLINTISIDDYAVNNKITFIKMDIEGSEIDAINGGIKTLKFVKPTLSICLYHKMNDLWEIPLLIKSIQPDYKIYLRQYEYTLYDTVCYAI
ncbi:FkbM family methyltransferase [Clostridium sp.]|uniref:FkbM family methyltransferase n=1 Tax=Clostridium sp. TaxID=1506 RepID=UPI0025C35007|nr:FkbM family methyltransferase [Clostridium sp.]MCI1715483.1 FkbM family methyltransferase [Clostridium sp.]MCI1799725.1 FkbM family methyltransferase [Clostridium sp.]MCI1813667.1 FkbM family methyltransferase [Clostridium sp.]MCI1870538.1 FkbM family methyltransferase [Clostridium sp.]